MPTIIVLAAGASKRLGRPKQLLQFEGEALVARAARVAAAVAPTIVVIPVDQRIREALPSHVTILENPFPDEGVASSIRLGVAAAEDDVVLMTCDQPLITSEHLRALVDAHSPIAATGYTGIVGVPAFFAAKFRDELLALRGDVGARGLIERHRDELVTVPFEAAALDVDTAADYNSPPFQRS
jgi:molybdenum cofactor cytidylyltransferase